MGTGKGAVDNRELKEANSSRGPANIVLGKWSAYVAGEKYVQPLDFNQVQLPEDDYRAGI